MEITPKTKVSDILDEYGDIADVMEVFGVKRVARFSFRKMLTKALTVEVAARVHRVPLDEFLETQPSRVRSIPTQTCPTTHNQYRHSNLQNNLPIP
jgi:hypothetical protein